MASVGTLLKKERDRKKITLDQISQETKIGKKYLLAIEADNYTIFPGETYIIGFIRNYARALEFDPSEVINLYKSSKIGSNIEETMPEITPEEEHEEKKPAKKEIKKPIEKISEKSTVKREKDATPKEQEEEDFEVVELIEELPEKGKKREKIIDIKKQESKLFRSPLKEKKLINIAHIIIGAGSLVIILVLFFMIKFIIYLLQIHHAIGHVYLRMLVQFLLHLQVNGLQPNHIELHYMQELQLHLKHRLMFFQLCLIHHHNHRD